MAPRRPKWRQNHFDLCKDFFSFLFHTANWLTIMFFEQIFSTRWFHEIYKFCSFFFSHYCTEQSELRPTCAAALKNWALWWELTTDWDDTTAGADFIKTTDRTLGRAHINKIRLLCPRQLVDSWIFVLIFPLHLPVENNNKYSVIKIRQVQINKLPRTLNSKVADFKIFCI